MWFNLFVDFGLLSPLRFGIVVYLLIWNWLSQFLIWLPKFATDKNVPYHGMMYASYNY